MNYTKLYCFNNNIEKEFSAFEKHLPWQINVKMLYKVSY